jgi:excisionase family DNA binding protein
MAEAADYLRVSQRTIRNMRIRGDIKAYRSGARLVRFDLNEIDALMGHGSNGDGAA